MQTAKRFRVVTCADAAFFHFLPTLERNVKMRLGQYPIIYDLGMTDAQIASLKSTVLKADRPEDYNSSTDIGNIKATHKPSCLLDFMGRFSEDCLYVDADVLFTDLVTPETFSGADIAVTPRHPNEVQSETAYINGTINTGVLFFRNTDPVKTFIKTWIAQCKLEQRSDQMAMSELLEDVGLKGGGLGMAKQGTLNILKLDARIYNDVGCTTGKIWHFKNAGRRFHKRRRYIKAALLDRFMPAHRSRVIAQRRQRELGAETE